MLVLHVCQMEGCKKEGSMCVCMCVRVRVYVCMCVQTTFEQLHMRLNNMDSGSGDSRIMTYARMTDLREAENSLLDGLRLQGETADRMQRTINQLVADVERIASSYNSSEQVGVEHVTCVCVHT